MNGDDPDLPSEPFFDFEESSSSPTSESAQGQPELTQRKKFEPKPLMQYQGRTIIQNQGRIAFLMLPNKFELVNSEENEFCKHYDYKIPNYESMKIGHWDWANPNSQFSDLLASNFTAVLALEPHVLTDDEMEILEEVIPQEVYGHNGAFELTSLKTEVYGGKSVLVMENRWWDVDRKAFGLFYPSDDSGLFLESLHFEGTDWDFRKTFLSAKSAFIRIKWRS